METTCRYVTVVLFIFFTVCGQKPVEASEKGIGVGVIVGDPTGIDAKFWLSDKNAIGVAVGYSFIEPKHIHIHGDYLYHTDPVGYSDSVEIPVYFGLGCRLKFREDKQNDEEETRLGVRVPVGLDFVFRKAPLDLFLEVAPIMEVIPETEFSLNGGLGIRYFFR